MAVPFLVLVLLLAFPFWIVDATGDQDQDLAGCKLEALRTYPTPPPDVSRPPSGYAHDSSGVGRMLLEQQQLQQARDEYVNLCMQAKGYKPK
jgi:hypothetical protein